MIEKKKITSDYYIWTNHCFNWAIQWKPRKKKKRIQQMKYNV